MVVTFAKESGGTVRSVIGEIRYTCLHLIVRLFYRVSERVE